MWAAHSSLDPKIKQVAGEAAMGKAYVKAGRKAVAESRAELAGLMAQLRRLAWLKGLPPQVVERWLQKHIPGSAWILGKGGVTFSYDD